MVMNGPMPTMSIMLSAIPRHRPMSRRNSFTGCEFNVVYDLAPYGGVKMRRILPLAIVLVAIACTTSRTTTRQPENPTTTPVKVPLFGKHGFDTTGMDRSVNACDDFYRFAVGKWRDTHPLPAQYS